MGTLPYSLNPKGANGKRTARPCYRQTLSHDDIIGYIMERHPGMSEGAIRSSLITYFTQLEEEILRGNKIVTPVAVFGATVQGEFDDSSDYFEPSKHRVGLAVSASKSFRKRVCSKITPTIVKQSLIGPYVAKYLDLADNTENQLPLGGAAEIRGEYLKTDPDDPEQGVFLKACHSDVSHRLEITENRPSLLRFKVPSDLPRGEYQLEVKNRPNKAIRIDILRHTLITSIAGKPTSHPNQFNLFPPRS